MPTPNPDAFADTPLPPGDARYVDRPWGGGRRLATFVRHGLGPIVVTGGPGTGKSTELAQAGGLLDGDHLVVRVAVDRVLEPDVIDANLALFEFARLVVEHVVGEDDTEGAPSIGIIKDLRASDPRFPRGHGKTRPPAELLAMALDEVGVLSGRGRPVVLVDGLDRAPADRARRVIEALLAVRGAERFVLTVSPALANGPESHEVLSRARVFAVGNAPVRGEGADDGRAFLAEIVVRRGGEAVDRALIDRAATASGGIPRLLLGLLADAARFAAMAERDAITTADLDDAVADAADRMRRRVLAGDLDALAAADGTSGLEVPPDRRVRFLSQSLLVEVGTGADLVAFVHPLVERLLPRAAPPKRKKRG